MLSCKVRLGAPGARLRGVVAGEQGDRVSPTPVLPAWPDREPGEDDVAAGTGWRRLAEQAAPFPWVPALLTAGRSTRAPAREPVRCGAALLATRGWQQRLHALAACVIHFVFFHSFTLFFSECFEFFPMRGPGQPG